MLEGCVHICFLSICDTINGRTETLLRVEFVRVRLLHPLLGLRSSFGPLVVLAKCATLLLTLTRSHSHGHARTVSQGMLTLLAAATTEGWVDAMNAATDSTVSGNGPELNANPGASLFFLVFMVVVAFYMTNVFVSYVIVVFSGVDERRFRSLNLTKNQRQCVAHVLEAKPEPMYQPVYRIQHKIHKIAASNGFDVFIMVCIIANTACLLTQYRDMPQDHADRLAVANNVFVTVFACEAVLKLVAFNPTTYFLSGWNVMVCKSVAHHPAPFCTCLAHKY